MRPTLFFRASFLRQPTMRSIATRPPLPSAMPLLFTPLARATLYTAGALATYELLKALPPIASITTVHAAVGEYRCDVKRISDVKISFSVHINDDGTGTGTIVTNYNNRHLINGRHVLMALIAIDSDGNERKIFIQEPVGLNPKALSGHHRTLKLDFHASPDDLRNLKSLKAEVYMTKGGLSSKDMKKLAATIKELSEVMLGGDTKAIVFKSAEAIEKTFTKEVKPCLDFKGAIPLTTIQAFTPSP